MVTKRVECIGESQTLEVKALESRLRAEGKNIISLSAGEPDFDPPEELLVFVQKSLAGVQRYEAVEGLYELRIKIIEEYNRRFDSCLEVDNVIITVGAKSAIALLFLALLETGDEAIVISPYWVSYIPLISLTGATVSVIDSSKDNFLPSIDSVLAAISPASKLVVLNYPSNPTAQVVSEDFYKELSTVLGGRDLIVLNDETYLDFVYPPLVPASIATYWNDNFAIVGSFSKKFAIPGWRVGYLIANKVIIKAVKKLQSHFFSHPSSIAMYGALGAFKVGQKWFEEKLKEYKDRRDKLVSFFDDLNWNYLPPKGTFYIFLDITRAKSLINVSSSVEVAKFFLQDLGISVVPGIAFGNDSFVRISYAVDNSKLTTFMERFYDWYRRVR